MKIYQVVDAKIGGDEFVDYTGIDAAEALKIATRSWDSLSAHDRKRSIITAREYTVPADTDLADDDELTNALCENPDYDTLAEFSEA